MAEPYLRQATFVDGDLILAEHGNAEFNQLVKAFHDSTGHNHDGTVGGGAYVPLLKSPDGLQSLILGVGGVTGTVIKDEDDMSSDSAIHLATQQSIKAYVDLNSTDDRAYSDLALSDRITELLGAANTWGANQTYSNAVICQASPTNIQHLTRKDYVDSEITSGFTNFLGLDNVFTGTNTFSAVPKTSADPVVANDLTKKSYVDGEITTLSNSIQPLIDNSRVYHYNPGTLVLEGSGGTGSSYTKIDNSSGTLTLTLTTGTFEIGDTVEVSRLSESSGNITITTSTGTFLYDGNDITNETTMNDKKFVTVATKVTASDFALSITQI